MRWKALGYVAVVLSAILSEATSLRADGRLVQVPGQAEIGTVEIHGVAAGAFDAKLWDAGSLHFVADVRSPLLRPRYAGVFRNIYAPSAVQIPGGWRVFYGAWDGVPSGNDRIYSTTTADFLDFSDRQIEIEHGRFIHVCNVNAIALPKGAFRMVCTAYPDAKGLNKPAMYASPDGRTWNGSPAPYAARPDDLITLEGYAPFADADTNGLNVLLYEEGAYRLYFGDFAHHGHVHRASSSDGKNFRYDGVCLDSPHMVNDVKKFTQSGGTRYLMGLHANGQKLWYALSTDGMSFGQEHELATNLGDADKYMVAIGWVVQDDRLLGVLYGAGAASSLDRNRIYGRWLQKKLVFTADDGSTWMTSAALGPDRAIISLGEHRQLSGKMTVLAEDGLTEWMPPQPLKLVSGGVYQIKPE